jgi:hypothetical protein
MRRRKGGTVAVLGGVFLAAVAAYAILPEELASFLTRRLPPPDISSSRASTVYVLDRQRWTVFSTPGKQALVKLVKNASVPSDLDLDESLSCQYSIRVQALGSGGKVLREQDVVVRSGPLSFRDEETGQVRPAQSYLGEPVAPLSPRISVLNFDGLSEPPHRLRLRQGPGDPRVLDVAARLYVVQAPPRHKLGYLWQRMPLAKRARLARGNVHSLELLTEAEKQNLLENRWVALPAQGETGRDYFDRKLYSLLEREGTSLGGSVLPRGLYVGPDALGSIPLPESARRVRLELRRVGLAEQSAEVRVGWHQRGLPQPDVEVLRVEDRFFAASFERGPGLLEVESADDVVVRCFLEGGATGDVEITPEPRSLPGYLLRADAPLTYSLASWGEGRSAMRVDARRLFPRTPTSWEAEAFVRYELVDASGERLGGGVFLHEEPLSRHDRSLGASRGWRVSEPSRHYLRLPGACVAVRLFSSDEGVSVTAYTRPEVLTRRVRVPEDYLPYERAHDDSRDWFHLKPANSSECVATEREVFTRVQARVPDADAAEPREVRALRPLEDVTSLRVLTPADPGAPEDRAASPVLLARLHPGETTTLRFDADPGLTHLRPRLLCLKESERPAPLCVRIDGKILASLRVASPSSELSLPSIAAGDHAVAVDILDSAEPCEVYLDRSRTADDGGSEAFVERTIVRLGPHGLTFQVRKETRGRETLCLRVYGPEAPEPGRAIRATVRAGARLEGVPVDSWTFGETVYRIRPGTGRGAKAIGWSASQLAGGELFFLVLGADLEPGAHEVAFTLEEGPPCFLQVHHVVPGERATRRVVSGRGALSGDPASEAAE